MRGQLVPRAEGPGSADGPGGAAAGRDGDPPDGAGLRGLAGRPAADRARRALTRDHAPGPDPGPRARRGGLAGSLLRGPLRGSGYRMCPVGGDLFWKDSARLADGREIIYYDESPGLGRAKAPDLRPLR